MADTVTSNDGTVIHYETIGRGPALVIVPGALAVAADYSPLANVLAHEFTVHTMERRGRGLSGPQGDQYSLSKECEDVAALQARTGARYILGHSFGGLITLEVARNNPVLTHVAVYEPGVSIDGSIPVAWVPVCQAELRERRFSDAFVTFVRGINPSTSGKAPRWLLKVILAVVISARERRQKYHLLDGTIREHQEAARLNNSYPSYREISAHVLFMAGSRSQEAVAIAFRLAAVVHGARVVVGDELDHFAPEKKPDQVAKEIVAHFRRQAFDAE